jgi:osmoprotectant transport system substrate-binding protein
MRRVRGSRARIALLSAAFVLAACQINIGPPTGRIPGESANSAAIEVASFDFSESVLVAELYARVLQERGYPVRRLTGLGSREVVQPALLQDRVDLVPEYLGTALGFVTLGRARITSDARAMHRRLARVLRPEGISVMDYASAENKNGVAVTVATAARYDLESISDLREEAPSLSFGGPPECPERPLCLPGLQSRYGLRFEEFVPLDPGGPTTVAALRDGGIDVALLFSTDPRIAQPDLVLLRDDRELQPAENIVPILRSSVLERFGPGLREALQAVTEHLTTSSLRALNFLVEIRGEDPREVARRWIAQRELAT